MKYIILVFSVVICFCFAQQDVKTDKKGVYQKALHLLGAKNRASPIVNQQFPHLNKGNIGNYKDETEVPTATVAPTTTAVPTTSEPTHHHDPIARKTMVIIGVSVAVGAFIIILLMYLYWHITHNKKTGDGNNYTKI